MLTRIAELGLRVPKIVLGIAGLLLVLGGVFGAPVANHLSTGGFTDPNADSTRASALLDSKFNGGQPNLVFLIKAKGGVNDPAAVKAGKAITAALAKRTEWVNSAHSYWTVPAGAQAGFVSRDKTQGLVAAHVKGNDNEVQLRAADLNKAVLGNHPGVTIVSGGPALAYSQVNDQTKLDLAKAEAISIPLTAIALILVFGSMIAAMLPLAIGILSIIGTLAILRGLSMVTDVSIYAMNMTTALGLALAIDYSLFMVSRYREELKAGKDPHSAVVTTVQTAGRTVLFSALTVALSLAALIVFPMYFLRSFAYAGLAVVSLAAIASIVVLPACLALIGPRINSYDLRAIIRHRLGRPDPVERTLEQGTWYRLARQVMKRPIVFGVAVTAIFVSLGSPFLRAQFGYPDDRVLTTQATARQAGDTLRADFAQNPSAELIGVAESMSAAPKKVAEYTVAISRLKGVQSVTSAAGTWANGKQLAPSGPGYTSGSAAMFTVSTSVDPFSKAGTKLVHDLRALPSPWPVLYTGGAAFNVDAMHGLGAKLPLALGLIALATFVVLFLFTGSVMMPLKALVLNTLSLSATFGAMVWVFQEGHLSSVLGFTSTGYLVANMVILMFCLAFGMSMDYEVFLLSRIREAWTHSGKTDADNEHAVSIGLARTGRIVTAAAALMSIVFAAMVISKVAFMQLFGLGLTLAVLADATLVRGILVPAFMRLMGRANWWAPAPLRRLHDRFGLSEGEDAPATASTRDDALRSTEPGTAAAGTAAAGTAEKESVTV